ncbi:MAG: S-layer homology domain-containing protein [Kineothrix sp.]
MKRRIGITGILLGILLSLASFPVSAAEAEQTEEPPSPDTEGVPIDEISFPDPLFRTHISENCDWDRDGILSAGEIEGTTELTLQERRSGFESVKGIEYFSALKSFRFEGWFSTLAELDLSRNTALETLYLHCAGLTELDLSKNKNLRSLTCSNMPGGLAEGLDISRNDRLESLDFYVVDPVKPLDISRNTSLKYLSVELDIYEEETNNFDRLDVSKNTELEELYFCIRTGREVAPGDLALRSLVLDHNKKLKAIELRGVPVIALDLRHNLLLEKLVCRNSSITELDVSRNGELRVLDCRDNALKELDVSRNLYLEKLVCGGNHIGWLDLSANKNLRLFLAEEVMTESGFPMGEGNQVYIREPRLDLSNYPELDKKGMSELENLRLEGENLVVEDPSREAGYRYDCGGGRTMKVAVAVDADRNTATNYKILFSGNGADSGEMEALAGCRRDRAYIFPANGFSRAGYSFSGWNTRADGRGQTYSDQATVRNLAAESQTEVYVYAQWEKDTAAKPVIPEKEFIFKDVKVIPGNWKYESVKYVYNRSFMGPVGGSLQFQPDSPLTRTMFATVIYRMEGSPKVSFRNRFTDVERGKWYSDAVYWASNKGIVHGYSDGSYGINKNITREQIAKMLYLFAQSRDYDVSGRASLDGFTDSEKVSGWAVSYMKWAVKMGMISGKPNKDGTYRLDPGGEASRAECAKMLKMFSVAFFDK